jgi:hypothetical protein
MINVTKEPRDTPPQKKKPTKRKSRITKKFMEKILDLVNLNVQDAVKKFQDTKNKEHEKTQKEINELREDFNKH